MPKHSYVNNQATQEKPTLKVEIQGIDSGKTVEIYGVKKDIHGFSVK